MIYGYCDFRVFGCFFVFLLKGGGQRSITATILMCDRQSRLFFSSPERQRGGGGIKLGHKVIKAHGYFVICTVHSGHLHEDAGGGRHIGYQIGYDCAGGVAYKNFKLPILWVLLFFSHASRWYCLRE